ncbi:hypothetical protein [Cryobacterium ruanii]|uniref:Uncharacterized protein n=1 Tax=Cryobacterium ruanii TaxID=1259197 RepID=A0A4R9ALD8_9MICO|nr:hypothetical protein [Cryobacterium ruanii]TFD64209.1 hypothetical protein E3T47_11975 [Cryobacterium ruanii]
MVDPFEADVRTLVGEAANILAEWKGFSGPEMMFPAQQRLSEASTVGSSSWDEHIWMGRGMRTISGHCS